MHKQMTLQELITHIIIEDTNMKECAIARAKALSAKANMVEDKLDHKRKNNFRNSRPNGSNPTFKKKGNCFICEKPNNHAPQSRHRARNDNPSRTNITQREYTIVTIYLSRTNITQREDQCEQVGGRFWCYQAHLCKQKCFYLLH